MNYYSETERLNHIAESDNGYNRGINKKIVVYTANLFMKEMKKRENGGGTRVRTGSWNYDRYSL